VLEIGSDKLGDKLVPYFAFSLYLLSVLPSMYDAPSTGMFLASDNRTISELEE